MKRTPEQHRKLARHLAKQAEAEKDGPRKVNLLEYASAHRTLAKAAEKLQSQAPKENPNSLTPVSNPSLGVGRMPLNVDSRSITAMREYAVDNPFPRMDVEQRLIERESLGGYLINGWLSLIGLAALWADASRIGAGIVLVVMAAVNFGTILQNRTRLHEALKRDNREKGIADRSG